MSKLAKKRQASFGNGCDRKIQPALKTVISTGASKFE